jgi:hypothetical protein
MGAVFVSALSMQPAKVPRSSRVLVLIDWINPLNFPGA